MFSVIIPAYNCEGTITETLNSVLNQTRIDLIEEIIIVNDGSSDNTEAVVQQYISTHKETYIKLFNQDNLGVSAARNKGIKMANAEWIALLDSDDIWLNNKIERQAEVIRGNQNIVFLGSAYPLKIYWKKYVSGLFNLSAQQLCFRYTPSTPSVVFKREVGVKLGLFDENMKFGEDINFFQRFLRLNSYYVLAENLIKISIGKSYFGECGLSSNLRAMHKGRTINTMQMYRDGMITKRYLIFTLVFNELKFLRRVFLVNFSRLVYWIKRKSVSN